MTEHSLKSIVEHQLCAGCGACAYACSNQAVELRNFIDIGIRPIVDADRCRGCGECLDVCPSHRLEHRQEEWPAEVLESLSASWGPVLEIWEGHSADPEIRHRGGSGGAATALALFCLEQQQMHGVLHVGMDPESPHLNRTVVSTSREQLLSRTGARYAPAAVCAELAKIEDAPQPCVLIGKPCDIAAAHKARRLRPKLDQNLGLTISIFCAGTPSSRGTLELLRRLGVDPSQVADLRYRGHGWPGMTGVNLRTDRAGRVEMTYQQAWDTILTKYKPFRCQICPDGTGEFADLACGDPWYRPIQAGEAGSTLIVVRTHRGRSVLRAAIEQGYLIAERRDPNVLDKSQPALLMRRSHLLPKLAWRMLLGLPSPRLRGFSLWRSWLRTPLRRMPTALVRAARWMLSMRLRGRRLLTDAEIRQAPPIAQGRATGDVETSDVETSDRGTHSRGAAASSLDVDLNASKPTAEKDVCRA